MKTSIKMINFVPFSTLLSFNWLPALKPKALKAGKVPVNQSRLVLMDKRDSSGRGTKQYLGNH